MKNNRILTFFICLSLCFVIASFALFALFLMQNNLSWSDYWQKSDFYGSIAIPKLKFSKGIKTLHKELTFPLKNKLNITVDIESVSFVEEEREDILVVYDYRHPNSPEYDIDFKAFSTEDEIQIIATTKAKNMTSLPFSTANLDGIYRGSIIVYLPADCQLDTLRLTTSVLNINQEMLYENANNYILASSMGNIHFTVEKPKHNISIDSDLGNISIEVSAEVNVFDLISNLGNAYLHFHKPLGTLYVINSFGLNSILLEDRLDDGNIQNNVGNIQFYSSALPKSLSVSTLTGDIFGYLEENPLVYLHSEQGQVSSFFTIKEDDSHSPLLHFITHSGNITLLPPTTENFHLLKQDNPIYKTDKSASTPKKETFDLSTEESSAPADDTSSPKEELLPYSEVVIPASGVVSGSSVELQ